MRKSCGVKYYTHIAPNGGRLVWIAIPATGNCFRRRSLGFKPVDYVENIEYRRKDYDLIGFVRNPLHRFAAVWSWMKEHTSFDFIHEDPYSLDRHLRPQYTFDAIFDVDYLGKFETLESDWEKLRGKYDLGPFKKPPNLIGTPNYRDLLTKDQLKGVLKFYTRDFSEFGYEQQNITTTHCE